ncbi:ABC transporter substrate-binding protein [Comamonas phosphati]|nr:ABC transporter substrate-binding protein [Comamonas phosphati]
MKRRALLAAGTSVAAMTGLGAAARAEPAPLRVALISPNTGALAAFGATNVYVQGLFAERLAAGLDTQHLGRRAVRLELYDAASSSEKAAQHAAALAADGVHLMLASATPEICNPVADVCEAAGVPCITTVAPWQAWFHGRKGNPDKGFQWTFHFFAGLEDFASVYSSLFERAGLGTQVGGIWLDDIDGTAFLSAMPRAMTQRNLTLFNPGRLRMAAPDYAGIATRLRNARVQMVTGVLPPPVALEFFAAARQVGYRPRMASIAKAFPFPDTVAQIAQPDLALTNEVWWSPVWPFRSDLSGTSSEQVAREYEQRTGRPWIQTLGFSHALVDLAAQAVQQAQAPTRQGLVEALRRIKAKTVVGPLSFAGRLPSLNVCTTPAVGGQWLRDGEGRWVLQVVDNTRSPFIPVTARFSVDAG